MKFRRVLGKTLTYIEDHHVLLERCKICRNNEIMEVTRLVRQLVVHLVRNKASNNYNIQNQLALKKS